MPKRKKTVTEIAKRRLAKLVDQQNRVLEAELAGDADTPKGQKRLETERRQLEALMIEAGVSTPMEAHQH